MWPKPSLPFSKFSLRSLLTARNGVWLGLSLLLVFSVYGQISLRRSRFWVAHTFEVLDAIQQTETNLIDAQANLQAFKMNPQLPLLIQYQQDMAAAREHLRQLERLTADNPIQQRNLQQLTVSLEQQSQEQEGILQQILLKEQLANSPGVFLLIYSPELRQEMVAIRQVEHRLLQQRRTNLNHLGIWVSGLTAFGILSAGLMFGRVLRDQQRQQQGEAHLNERLDMIELEQDLNSHLLACRNFDEAHDILRSFLERLLPNCVGAVYEISNSRDQMVPTIHVGSFNQALACSPRECWALRRGTPQDGQQNSFKIPCQLCRLLHPEGVPAEMMCLPLQAHEQTIGILHLAQVAIAQQPLVTALAHQIALPLAVLHLQAELEHLSFHDANTGIYNRRFLDEMLNRAIAKAQRQNYQVTDSESIYSVGVIFMDVDHFKRFNSEYGHQVGDTVLQTLGRYLTEVTRAGEDVPCRYGGEEFVLIMPGASEAVTLAKAERIRLGIKQHPAPNGALISLSLGVAVYPQHGTTAEDVLRAANVALLAAKAEGRDRVVLAGV